ncbi:MAG: hypothetical protein FWF15_05875, partial [Oscillospiraceae bacterium]|nr:hypothetical protein [Oscillospiraceae bacterium]
TETDKHKLVHVKVTYPEHRGKLDIIEEHNVLPAGAKITIDGGYKSAKIIPCGTDVLTCCKDGKTEITLPQIVGYVCAALEK